MLSLVSSVAARPSRFRPLAVPGGQARGTLAVGGGHNAAAASVKARALGSDSQFGPGTSSKQLRRNFRDVPNALLGRSGELGGGVARPSSTEIGGARIDRAGVVSEMNQHKTHTTPLGPAASALEHTQTVFATASQ